MYILHRTIRHRGIKLCNYVVKIVEGSLAVATFKDALKRFFMLNEISKICHYHVILLR